MRMLNPLWREAQRLLTGATSWINSLNRKAIAIAEMAMLLNCLNDWF